VKPDRNNYQALLAEWIEGSLGPQETRALLSFLAENPDIEAEAGLLSCIKLSPPDRGYAGKESLKRRAPELSPSQVEYLSAAYLENDITEDQLSDLMDSIDQNPANRKIFDSMQQVKLEPLHQHFIYKDNLRKKSQLGGMSRFFKASLNAAAVLLFMLVSYFFLSRLFPGSGELPGVNNNEKAGNSLLVAEESNIINPGSTKQAGPENREQKGDGIHYPATIRKENIFTAIAEAEDLPGQAAVPDPVISSFDSIDAPGIPGWKKPVAGYNHLAKPTPPDLIGARSTLEPAIADNQGNNNIISLTRTVRDRIFRKSGSGDFSVNSFEIARAGIEGLNKILGWQMALVATTDDNGETESVYFSSRNLKFNIPVKKDQRGQ
jgi:hypothetical protein